jgi:hypothetical protein
MKYRIHKNNVKNMIALYEFEVNTYSEIIQVDKIHGPIKPRKTH